MILYNLLRKLLYFVIIILAIFNGKLLKFFKSRLFQKMDNNSFLNSNEEAILIHFSSVGEFNLTKELISEILEGKKTVCFPACEEDLLKSKAILVKERAVKDGNVVTSRSAGTAMDFSLMIISELLGEENAEKISKEIVL